jgi:colicin import membrane protein
MKRLLIAGAMITVSFNALANEDYDHSMAVTKSNNAAYSWIDSAKMAFTGAFPDMQNYKGQSCTLRLSFGGNAALTNAKVEKGDKTLCSAATQAAWNTKFPPFPDDATYQMFKSFPLDLSL